MQSELSTYNKILNSAEELFAGGGFNGVSVRNIADRAGVRQALIHYHFNSKEGLYVAVIKRRIDALSGCRRFLLEHYLEDSGNTPLSLERLVEAFISPYLYLSLNGGVNWRHYSKLVSRLLINDLDILNNHFNVVALAYIDELRRSMPGAGEAAVQWGFDFMVGVMCNTFSEVDRINTLSEGSCSVDNIYNACSYMMVFITGGLSALNSGSQFCFNSSFDLLREHLKGDGSMD